MRVLLASIIFFVLTLLVPDLAAQSWRVESTKISEAAQDSTGQVWGITYYVGWGLYRWEGDTWKADTVKGVPSGAGPRALVCGPDGAVYCLWSAGGDTHAVTQHHGSTSTLVVRFAGHLAERPHIFVDEDRNVWLTEHGRHIFRVTPQGEAECLYTIANEQFLEYGRPEDEKSGFNPVYATEDGRGRIWFWSDSLAGGTNIASLEGVLIFDGEKFEHHSHITGVPDKKFSIVAPDDKKHMWLAVAGDQLYRVDVNTLTATPVPPPNPQTFRYVQKIFHANQETYVVSGSVWQPVPERSGEGRSGALWQLKGSRWARLVNGLHMRPDYAQHPSRPLLATGQGLWLGNFGVGPWFIPKGKGKPALVGWRYGFPLDGSERLFQLEDGQLLIISANQGSIAVKPSDLLGAFQFNPGVSTLNPLRPFIQDVRGHILGILATGDNALSDWDGKTWNDHRLPADFDPARFWTFAADSTDRVWLLPGAFGRSVAIFDPKQQTFDAYPDYREALQAQLPRREGFHLEDNLFMVPSFSQDGRICYRDAWYRIWYFNGQKWMRWRRRDIDGHNTVLLDGPTFFNRAGNVAVNIEGRTWQFTETGGWHTTNFERGLGTDRERQARQRVVPPPGCEISNPESVAQDRLGTFWLTYRGQLYRAIPGLCLQQFSPEERQPFIDSRTVKKVFIDPLGNAFLETYFHSNPQVGEYAIVKARPPLPKTELSATVDASGAVKLKFEARPEAMEWFTWRFDGGPWAVPTGNSDITVEWLPHGKHRIEATTIGERLQVDPTPAVVQVEIHVDPRGQVLALINELSDPDYSVRNTAVAGLLRQGAAALPLLRSEREKADADQRWWIDAVIQQIEDSIARSEEP